MCKCEPKLKHKYLKQLKTRRYSNKNIKLKNNIYKIKKNKGIDLNNLRLI